jgi:hypothetical protein
MELFSKFLGSENCPKYQLDDIADATCRRTESDSEKPTRTVTTDPLVWKWRHHVLNALSPLILSHHSRCEGKTDFTEAAEMTMKCVAHHDHTGLEGNAAIAYAERMMKRSCQEYATWLEMLCDVNNDAVLFAVQKSKAKLARVGVSVIVPMTETMYNRFREGLIEDGDIGKDSLLPRSLFLYGNAVAQSVNVNLRSNRISRGIAQVKTLLNQLASLCKPLDNNHDRVSIVAFAGTKTNSHRLKSTDFEELESRTPVTGKRIVECAYPRNDSKNAFTSHAAYIAMRGVIELYQKAQSLHDVSARNVEP